MTHVGSGFSRILRSAAHVGSGFSRIFRRRLLLACLLVLLALTALDALRPPERQWTTAIAIGSVHAYHRTISPVLAACGLRCRFTPTCSHYAETVLRKHGIVAGTWLAMRRVARCGPWTAAGTVDVPQ